MSNTDDHARLLRTPLYNAHVRSDARIVDFGGWALPVHYGSQVEEHHAVRRSAGMFDVSHMTIIDIRGTESIAFLRRLLANDIASVAGSPGTAMYSCMLNRAGGVIDDLIVYHESADSCRMVTNATTREKDVAWLRRESKPFSVELSERPDLAILAVQGPNARDATLALLPPFMAEPASNLKRFRACHIGEWFIGRTGYTGEDGFEIILPGEDAPGLWNKLLESGVWPCGLGARDTLRLEAGMALYGADLSEEYTPLDSGLAWTVDLGDEAREFNGHEAVLRQKKEGSALQMTGLVLEGRGVLRAHQAVFDRDRKLGEITSGTFSPTLEKSVALARLSLVPDADLEVDIRGRRVKTRAVKYPFVRNGRACI